MAKTNTTVRTNFVREIVVRFLLSRLTRKVDSSKTSSLLIDRVSPIGFTKESSKSQTTYLDVTFSHGIIALSISCIHGSIDIRTFHSCGGLLGFWYP